MVNSTMELLVLFAWLCCLASCSHGTHATRPSYQRYLSDPDPYYDAIGDRYDYRPGATSQANTRPGYDPHYPDKERDSARPFAGDDHELYDKAPIFDSNENRPSGVTPVGDPSSEYTCRRGQYNHRYIPSGRPSELSEKGYIGKYPDLVTEFDCARKCCNLGPTVCQYVWIFKETCYLVGCDSDDQDLCRPKYSPSLVAESTYFQIVYSPVKETEPSSSNVPTLATTVAPAETDSPQSTTSQPTEEPTSPEVTMATTSTTSSSSTPPSTSSLTTSPPTTSIPTTPPPTTPPSTTSTPTTPPPTTSTPTTSLTPSINVEVSAPTEITLPQNTVDIFASTWPQPLYEGEFSYLWEEISGPGTGTLLKGKEGKHLTLSGLIPGVYSLKLTVTSLSGEYGEDYFEITVHDTPRVNQPPTAIISPSQNIKISLPQNSVILDASESKDDLGADTLTFLWEEVQVPLNYPAMTDPSSAVQTLKNLHLGTYQYKLTVTDRDGAHSEAVVTIEVLKEKDYPPTANAGNPVLLHLPNNEVHLYGNGSTDDKGIVAYQWELLSGKSVDMEGSHTSILHVKGLALGMYTFRLNVTDTAQHTSSALVTVDVLEETLIPPVAVAGGDKQLVYPDRSVVLDGRASHDEVKITTYHWTQQSGPTDVKLTGRDEPVLHISELHIDPKIGSPTVYQFQLTVTNYRNLTSSDNVTVLFKKDSKIPPTVDAGPDMNITLPLTTAVLTGLNTQDEFGIVSYYWNRSDDSPAAGMPVGDTEKSPVLLLYGLVNGTYHFTLTATSKTGLVSSDSVTLSVLPNPRDKDIVQVHLEADASNFTKANLKRFGDVLKFSLELDEYEIHFDQVYPFGSHVVVELYMTRNGRVKNSTELFYEIIKDGQDQDIMNFHIVKVEMKVCQLHCSFHGGCDPLTKRCKCDMFWMENPFKANLGRKETNCDWSVFYFSLVILASVVVLVFLLWLCCCCCLRRRRKSRSRRRIKYAILAHKDGEETGDQSLQMLPRDSYQQTSLMVSESETEEELIFESKKLSKEAHSSTPRSSKVPNNNRNSGSVLNNATPK